MTKEGKCPFCPADFETKCGLRIHCARVHKQVFREIFPLHKPVRSPKFDEETIASLNRKSNLNILRFIKGDLSELTAGRKRILEREGVIKNSRGAHVRYTEKGLKLMEEIGNE